MYLMYLYKMMVVKSYLHRWMEYRWKSRHGVILMRNLPYAQAIYICKFVKSLYTWGRRWGLTLISAIHMNTYSISPLSQRLQTTGTCNIYIVSHEHLNSPWSKRQEKNKLWLASLAIKLTNSYAQATHVTLNSHILLAAYSCNCPLDVVAWLLLWVQEVRGHRFDHEPWTSPNLKLIVNSTYS